MFLAISRTLFARSLRLCLVCRIASPPATSRRLLFVESRRTFLMTASVAEEVETTRVTETAKDDASKDIKAPKKRMKVPYKRPSTSWEDFYRQYLKKHLKEGQNYTSYAAEASALWRAMSAEEKAKYGASEEQRAEYRKLSKEYRTTHELPKVGKKQRESKPRRDAPMQGYNLFVKENFDKSSSNSFWDQANSLAKRWRGMSASDKDEYRRRGIEIYEKHKAEAAEK